MNKTRPYGAMFYRRIEFGSIASARRVLPVIFDLVKPKSLLDVGCGDGSWLQQAAALGVNDLLGVDGPWVQAQDRKIAEEQFQAADLSSPLPIDRHFDLAMSLEVAEHLPATRAPSFVEQLTSLAPVVLFSAAVPGQGGTDHVNEQWPDYWADLFAAYGYRPIDAVRRALWADEVVESWYLQNAFLYVGAAALAESPRLQAEADRGLAFPMRVVHPRLLERAIAQPDLTVGRHLRRMPQAARTTLTNRLASRRSR